MDLNLSSIMTNRLFRSLKPVVQRFPQIASTYRLLRDGFVVPRPVTIGKGFKFDGNAVMASGEFEIEECILIENLLGSADVFVNVGANVGYYCCIALKAGVRTLAFEPIDMNLKFLYENITENGWRDHIEVFPVAVGETSGLIDIYGGGTGASVIQGWAGNVSSVQRTVPIVALDDVLGGRFNGSSILFLVDIEGAELSMLDGAKLQLTRKPRPKWVVEISVREHQPAGIAVNPNLLATFERFWDLGYQAFTANRLRRPVSRDELLEIVDGGDDTLCTHNFLFE